MRFSLSLTQGSRSRRADELFPKTLEIRVLIVADGQINFIIGEDFSLTDFCALLAKRAYPWENLTITTAHRSNKNLGAQYPDFKFDTQSASGDYLFSREHFEELWLFGYEGQTSPYKLSDPELKVVTDFMNAGGGVFATGDHQDLGFALCGSLPRVRSMRKWKFFNTRSPQLKAPDRNGPSRIDTLRMGSSAGFEANDQKDGTPQQICPKFFLDHDGRTAYPHYLLADGNFAITILPDHMHEGECLIPENLETTYQFDGDEPKEEYPTMLGIPARISPVTVAIATSASGLIDLEETPPIFPVEPRCFKIITAYDGHYVKQPSGNQVVKLGRVVADSSFHHFINLNLKGFFVNNTPTPDLETISKYYRNTLTWLLPANLQHHYSLNLLLWLRYSPELVEEFRSTTTFEWDEILHAGRIAWTGIAQNLSASEARSAAIRLAAFLPDDIRPLTKDYLDAWLPVAKSELRPPVLLDPKIVPITILGSALLAIAASLPESAHDAAEALLERESRGEGLDHIVTQGLMRGLLGFTRVLRDSNGVLGQVAEKLSAAVPH